jgi:hypothetical protein
MEDAALLEPFNRQVDLLQTGSSYSQAQRG